jgi:glycosyltransferase involved in cell wall biosynthesis
LKTERDRCGIGPAGFVEITGPRYGEEKYGELRKADLFVFPTYNDAFPLVTLEAMQFALPVISTNEGGVPDIVNDGETGFLVERQNVEQLAEKIALLLQNKELRQMMGQKGYERFCNILPCIILSKI